MTRPFKMMGTECFCHKHRELVPLEVHHVWPKGQKGPDIPANRVTVCANGHGATHDLLAKMVKADTDGLPWLVRRRYGRKVRRLASAGFQAITTRLVVTP